MFGQLAALTAIILGLVLAATVADAADPLSSARRPVLHSTAVCRCRPHLHAAQWLRSPWSVALPRPKATLRDQHGVGEHKRFVGSPIELKRVRFVEVDTRRKNDALLG